VVASPDLNLHLDFKERMITADSLLRYHWLHSPELPLLSSDGEIDVGALGLIGLTHDRHGNRPPACDLQPRTDRFHLDIGHSADAQVRVRGVKSDACV
jgi:hypothetical protein